MEHLSEGHELKSQLINAFNDIDNVLEKFSIPKIESKKIVKKTNFARV